MALPEAVAARIRTGWNAFSPRMGRLEPDRGGLMRIACAAILALVLAACSKAPQDIVPADGRTTLPPAVTMQITPLPTADCKPNAYVALVAWFIPLQMPFSGVEVRMETPDGKMFARSQARNYGKETGPWVHDGSSFFLIDLASQKVLARARAGAYDCKEELAAGTAGQIVQPGASPRATRSALAMIVSVSALAGSIGNAAPSSTYRPGNPATCPSRRHSCAAG